MSVNAVFRRIVIGSNVVSEKFEMRLNERYNINNDHSVKLTIFFDGEDYFFGLKRKGSRRVYASLKDNTDSYITTKGWEIRPASIYFDIDANTVRIVNKTVHFR